MGEVLVVHSPFVLGVPHGDGGVDGVDGHHQQNPDASGKYSAGGSMGLRGRVHKTKPIYSNKNRRDDGNTCIC